MEITESGRQALKSRMLDDLDRKLSDPDLIAIRHGMWAAMNSDHPDSQRQSAHSARELITKVLHKLAPNDEVRSSPEYKPDPSAQSGITRKRRLKHILKKKQPLISQEDANILEQLCELIDTLYDNLAGKSHAKPSDIGNDLKDHLQLVEIALNRIL